MKKWTIYYKKKTGNQLRKFGKNDKNTRKMIGLEKNLKKGGKTERKMKGSRERDCGVGAWMKNRCLCNTDKYGESNGKSGESYVYLFEILNAGDAMEDALI